MAILLDGRRVVSTTTPKKKTSKAEATKKAQSRLGTAPKVSQSPKRNNVSKPGTNGGSSTAVRRTAVSAPTKKTSTTRSTTGSTGYRGGATPYSGGSGGSSGGHSHGGGTVAKKPTKTSYLKSDSIYQTQLAALRNAMSRYTGDVNYQKANYNTDFSRAQKELGYDPKTKQWNRSDLMTASGRGFQNQLDDFAARGMLQSSAYGTESNNLLRTFQDQNTSLVDAKQKFENDLTRELANYTAENTSSRNAARAEAIARMAAKYSL